MKPSPFHGFLVIDKPGGLTSRDAVDRAQGWFPRRTRIGHTGTLDPLATGALVLAVGAGTRFTEYVQDMDKVYRTRLVLGATSDTDDADGTIAAVTAAAAPDRAVVDRAVHDLIGEIEQVPPAFSAAKLSGRRAYDLARRGQEVQLKPRRVHVYEIQILAYDYPRFELTVRCGKGTYIRSLARDLGERLGCGAYVEVLRRLRVGPFQAADGVSLDVDVGTARSRLLPLAAGLTQLPRVALAAAAIEKLRHGQSVPLEAELTGDVAVFDSGGELMGVAKADLARHVLAPARILSL